jgi:hypothetical protein
MTLMPLSRQASARVGFWPSLYYGRAGMCRKLLWPLRLRDKPDYHAALLNFWLDERIGELAPINVQFALSGSGIHDRRTPGISYV